MPHFEAEREVGHSAERMLDLVADIEAYPDFVPLCEALKIRDRQDDGDTTTLIADMTAGYRDLRETFTTRVVVDRGAQVVTATYLEGPFKHLDSRWTFTEIAADRCRVHFAIDYAFKSRILGALMGAAFSKAFGSFSDAFAARADIVYGKPALA